MIAVAGETDTAVYLFDRLDGVLAADAETDDNLCRGAVHGIDIREVDDSGFIAEVLERTIGHVEVHAFAEDVDADECLFVFMVDDCRVVADGLER